MPMPALDDLLTLLTTKEKLIGHPGLTGLNAIVDASITSAEAEAKVVAAKMVEDKKMADAKANAEAAKAAEAQAAADAKAAAAAAPRVVPASQLSGGPSNG